MSPTQASVLIVLPVLNEVAQLERSVRTLAEHCRRELTDWDWQLLIADNGSSDGTSELAAQLAADSPRIGWMRLDERGRGRALRRAWGEASQRLLCYMDIDLSTDLAALRPLLEALHGGHDLGTGSRHLPDSHTRRSLKREVLSRGYNLLVRWLLGSRLSDLQCGFKAITREAAAELLPHVENQHWFFDTELFVLAERAGYRIAEVPVSWSEDPDSRVKLISTIAEDLDGIARLRRTRARTLELLAARRAQNSSR